MSATKKLAFSAMALALAVAIGWAESFIPMLVPGAKPGLSNIVILLVLYLFSWKEASLVMLGKVLLVSLLRGTFLDVTFFMSLTGSILSLFVMILSRYVFKKVTIVGTSILGSYLHALGQILALAIYMTTPNTFTYFPILSLFSIVTGFLTGFVTERILSHPYFKNFDQEKSRQGD